jgi:hypothetical protein
MGLEAGSGALTWFGLEYDMVAWCSWTSHPMTSALSLRLCRRQREREERQRRNEAEQDNEPGKR